MREGRGGARAALLCVCRLVQRKFSRMIILVVILSSQYSSYCGEYTRQAVCGSVCVSAVRCVGFQFPTPHNNAALWACQVVLNRRFREGGLGTATVALIARCIIWKLGVSFKVSNNRSE